MIKSFVCVCGLLVSLNVVAASLKPVKGKVVDRFNNPLPGATIQVTHSPEKTITDVDGNFNFETIEDAGTHRILHRLPYPQAEDCRGELHSCGTDEEFTIA